MNGQSENVMKYEITVICWLDVKCLTVAMGWIIICLKVEQQYLYISEKSINANIISSEGICNVYIHANKMTIDCRTNVQYDNYETIKTILCLKNIKIYFISSQI